jgi:hypothetical protein
MISDQVLCMTLKRDNNYFFLPPSARAYNRHRNTTQNEHIGLFIQFLHEKKINLNSSDTALREILQTTTYSFDNDNITTNHMTPLSVDFIISFLFFFKKTLSNDIFASILWMHGCYLPKQKEAFNKIISFMKEYKISLLLT